MVFSVSTNKRLTLLATLLAVLYSSTAFALQPPADASSRASQDSAASNSSDGRATGESTVRRAPGPPSFILTALEVDVALAEGERSAEIELTAKITIHGDDWVRTPLRAPEMILLTSEDAATCDGAEDWLLTRNPDTGAFDVYLNAPPGRLCELTLRGVLPARRIPGDDRWWLDVALPAANASELRFTTTGAVDSGIEGDYQDLRSETSQGRITRIVRDVGGRLRMWAADEPSPDVLEMPPVLAARGDWQATVTDDGAEMSGRLEIKSLSGSLRELRLVAPPLADWVDVEIGDGFTARRASNERDAGEKRAGEWIVRLNEPRPSLTLELTLAFSHDVSGFVRLAPMKVQDALEANGTMLIQPEPNRLLVWGDRRDMRSMTVQDRARRFDYVRQSSFVQTRLMEGDDAPQWSSNLTLTVSEQEAELILDAIALSRGDDETLEIALGDWEFDDVYYKDATGKETAFEKNLSPERLEILLSETPAIGSSLNLKLRRDVGELVGNHRWPLPRLLGERVAEAALQLSSSESIEVVVETDGAPGVRAVSGLDAGAYLVSAKTDSIVLRMDGPETPQVSLIQGQARVGEDEVLLDLAIRFPNQLQTPLIIALPGGASWRNLSAKHVSAENTTRELQFEEVETPTLSLNLAAFIADHHPGDVFEFLYALPREEDALRLLFPRILQADGHSLDVAVKSSTPLSVETPVEAGVTLRRIGADTWKINGDVHSGRLALLWHENPSTSPVAFTRGVWVQTMLHDDGAQVRTAFLLRSNQAQATLRLPTEVVTTRCGVLVRPIAAAAKSIYLAAELEADESNRLSIPLSYSPVAEAIDYSIEVLYRLDNLQPFDSHFSLQRPTLVDATWDGEVYWQIAYARDWRMQVKSNDWQQLSQPTSPWNAFLGAKAESFSQQSLERWSRALPTMGGATAADWAPAPVDSSHQAVAVLHAFRPISHVSAAFSFKRRAWIAGTLASFGLLLGVLTAPRRLRVRAFFIGLLGCVLLTAFHWSIAIEILGYSMFGVAAALLAAWLLRERPATQQRLPDLQATDSLTDVDSISESASTKTHRSSGSPPRIHDSSFSGGDA